MCRKPSGLTLIEIIVAMAVLSVLMVAALQVFLPSLTRFQVADTTYDAQRNALTAVDQMARDLTESRLAWIGSRSAPSFYLMFPSPRDTNGVYQRNPDGTPAWQSWIVYWTAPDPQLENTFVLRRRVVSSSFPPGTLPPGPPLPEWTDDRGAQMVASGLADIAFNGNMGRNGRARVQVRSVARRNYQGKVTTFEGGRTVEIPY